MPEGPENDQSTSLRRLEIGVIAPLVGIGMEDLHREVLCIMSSNPAAGSAPFFEVMAPLMWRNTGPFPEGPAEIRRIVKAEFGADLRDAHGLVVQHLTGCIAPYAPHQIRVAPL